MVSIADDYLCVVRQFHHNRLVRPLTRKVWHEVAVGIGDVNHNSIKSRVSRSCVSI